jgi:hypothetical protein
VFSSTVWTRALAGVAIIWSAALLAGCAGHGGESGKQKIPPSGAEVERNEEVASLLHEEEAETAKNQELLAQIESKTREEAAEAKAKMAERAAKKKLAKEAGEARKRQQAAEAKLKAREKALKEAEAKTPADREAAAKRRREAERTNANKSQTVTIPQT